MRREARLPVFGVRGVRLTGGAPSICAAGVVGDGNFGGLVMSPSNPFYANQTLTNVGESASTEPGRRTCAR